MIKEACVETLLDCITAEKSGANRLELCAQLELGGTTPDFELVKSVLANVQIPVKVMIRNRGGNFVFSMEDIQLMKSQLTRLKELNVFGFVFGFLNEKNEMDIPLTSDFCELSKGYDVTIHKAFDSCTNPFETFESLKKLPFKVSLLTSGQKNTADEGKIMLKKLVENQEDKIKIIVAGKVTHENISRLHEFIGANEYHGKKIVKEG